MSSSAEIRQTFFQECDDLLEALDDGLCEIDEGVSDLSFDPETVNAVFRSVHSIKGGAAAFGLDQLVQFAHQFETVLDSMRSGSLTVNEEVLKLCHRAADCLNDLVVAGRDDINPPENVSQDLVEKLANLVPNKTENASVQSEGASDDFSFAPTSISIIDEVREAVSAGSTYIVKLRPHKSLASSGNDPLLLFRELSELGDLKVSADFAEVKSLENLQVEECRITWVLEINTNFGEAEIREVFEFVDGMCDLDISKLNSTVLQDDPYSSTNQSEVGANPENDANVPSGSDPVGRGKSGAVGGAANATVRVNLELVDRLINMVGELVINQAVLTQCIDDAGVLDNGELSTSLAEFKNLARDIQESVMAIRAQSVKPLFQRMARIVREASELSGKEALFETEGETTEVDKTIIERLVDPLTHMIRNAVDHGLEAPELRRSVGKLETGKVKLSAAHRSGRVIIEVSDDGAGINREKVFNIAVEKGLIPADSSLKDSEIDNLLFLPGFSTAEKVSNLSGRGVGMDVVRSAIQKLGGRVNIFSKPGAGTTMSISLPLTLAVLDGMVVDVAGQTMVVPITAIVETLRPDPDDIHKLGSDNTVVSVRNKLVPVVDLGVVFGHRSSAVSLSEMVLLLVESDDATSWALAVDQIFDQRQVVIKGLESNYGYVPGVAAATILGDGNIALIIDPEETARRSDEAGESLNILAMEGK
ncbi:MAG: chemotaxis protein CheA [Heliomarina sp.]|uniref:chemotaxis protein CheA n=1 Tax=Heliomarina sp. TaxID=2917556 RepID=UPI004058688A